MRGESAEVLNAISEFELVGREAVSSLVSTGVSVYLEDGFELVLEVGAEAGLSRGLKPRSERENIPASSGPFILVSPSPFACTYRHKLCIVAGALLRSDRKPFMRVFPILGSVESSIPLSWILISSSVVKYVVIECRLLIAFIAARRNSILDKFDAPLFALRSSRTKMVAAA